MSSRPDWVSAEGRARDALAAHADTAHLAVAGFTPIPDSLSNFAWRADAAPRAMFVRLARVGTEALGADLLSEARILQLVSSAGLAPPVLRCDPSQRLLVTRWIEPSAAGASATEDVVVESVARALAQLHRLPVSVGLRQVRFDEQARMLQATLPAAVIESHLRAVAEEAFLRLDATRVTSVLCHHDVHAKNMVIDRDARLWLVDWEYAGLNDPVFDLASFASQCELPPEATNRLCAAYATAGGAIDQGRLELARWAFDYVQWLWYRRLHGAASDGHGVQQAGQRLARIEHSLRERASALLRCNNGGFDLND